MKKLDSNSIVYLLSLILPPGCQCQTKDNFIYQISCPDDGTARGIWDKRFQSIYPLLEKGDVLEITGEFFQARNHPLPKKNQE